MPAQPKYRTVKTVLSRNKILMNNDAPSKTELDKVLKDISRLDKLQLNKVGCFYLFSSYKRACFFTENIQELEVQKADFSERRFV